MFEQLKVKVLILLILSLGVASKSFSTSEKISPFVSLGIAKTDYFESTENSQYHSSWSPVIGVGLGHELQLSENWSFESELRLDLSTASIRRDSSFGTDNTQLKTTSLWIVGKIKRDQLFENTSPFVSLELGRVNLDYQFDQETMNKNITAYKAIAGLEFDLENDMSVSVGVGMSNTEAIREN